MTCLVILYARSSVDAVIVDPVEFGNSTADTVFSDFLGDGGRISADGRGYLPEGVTSVKTDFYNNSVRACQMFVFHINHTPDESARI